MEGGQTPLTVVVVTYNSASVVGNLLDSLADGLTGVTTWELVVVDNDSQDGTTDRVRALAPTAKVVGMGRNAGYAAAINAGIRASAHDGDVLVLNPDVRLHEGSVSRLLVGLRAVGTGIAVPRINDDAGHLAPSLRRDPSVVSAWAEAVLGGGRASRADLGEMITNRSAYSSTHTVDWATGAVLAISASCRRDVGEWDERYFLYSEEVDYCQRARRLGFAVRYVPDAVVEHAGGPYGSNPYLWSRLVRSRVQHFAKNHGPVSTSLFRTGVVVGEALRIPVRRSARSGLRAALSSPVRREPGFVWFAAQDWWYHNQAHSDFQLMRCVARDRPVVVVNSLGLRLPRKGVSTQPLRRIGRKVRSMAKLVRRPVAGLPQFYVMTPIFLPLYGGGFAGRLNAAFVRVQVRAVARAVGAGPRPYVGATIPTAWPVIRGMRRSSLMFNRSDMHSAFPEADGERIAELEGQLLRSADTVLYVSRELMRLDAAATGDRAVFLDHGVDLERFSRKADAAEAPELVGIARPRVGFFGGLDDYVVDMKLLAEVARSIPEAQLVLVGDATCSMDELTSMSNVHWLGHRAYERIPAIGRGFDVAIMPWLDNEWIRFANPIKLREYLALGLPVVTTEYPQIDDYRDRVRVAQDHAQFVDLVRESLAEPGDPSARRSSVLHDSWSTRASTLVRLAARKDAD